MITISEVLAQSFSSVVPKCHFADKQIRKAIHCCLKSLRRTQVIVTKECSDEPPGFAEKKTTYMSRKKFLSTSVCRQPGSRKTTFEDVRDHPFKRYPTVQYRFTHSPFFEPSTSFTFRTDKLLQILMIINQTRGMKPYVEQC